MKVLFDECVVQAFRNYITGHDLFTAGYLGWKSLKNGALLAQAVGDAGRPACGRAWPIVPGNSRFAASRATAHPAQATTALELVRGRRKSVSTGIGNRDGIGSAMVRRRSLHNVFRLSCQPAPPRSFRQINCTSSGRSA